MKNRLLPELITSWTKQLSQTIFPIFGDIYLIRNMLKTAYSSERVQLTGRLCHQVRPPLQPPPSISPLQPPPPARPGIIFTLTTQFDLQIPVWLSVWPSRRPTSDLLWIDPGRVSRSRRRLWLVTFLRQKSENTF